MNKLELLKGLRFGERVAEEEADQLSEYFVETDQWNRLFHGEVDVVYGPKGSGKSALYTLLNLRRDDLFDRNVLIAPGENPRGAPVFQDLVSDPPTGEREFIALWKLYLLALIGETIRDYGVSNSKSEKLVKNLVEAKLLPDEATLSGIFRSVQDYIKKWKNRDVESIEHVLTFDIHANTPIVKRKATFREHEDARSFDKIPADDLLNYADSALREADFIIWLIFDRLDVAFAESRELEKNALRALFRTYNDVKNLSNIKIKIFVRDDLWRRISEGGFAEASHITKTADILWDHNALRNLVVRRLLSNSEFVEFFGIEKSSILKDFDKQIGLINNIFPEKVEAGKNPNTFEWILSRTHDGTRKNAPRELIHLLDCAREAQIKRLSRGENEPDGQIMFEGLVFKEALQRVSSVRYEQTLVAEYSEEKKYFEALRGEKAEQTVGNLARLWGVSREQALEIANRLHEFGFFERRGTKEAPSFWVPFLYRYALGLVQGKSAD